MLGAIIGDIVGSRFEFLPTNDYNFTMFADDCSFTDDTICTIAIADALLTGTDYGESLRLWGYRYPHPMGAYGVGFDRWLKSKNPRPYGSFGNGSAMRVSPVGWWFQELVDVAREASATAECTHNHPEGIKGARAVAIAIHQILMKRRETGRPLTGKETAEALRRSISLYSQGDEFRVDYERARNRFDETCQGTVPVALEILLRSNGFEDAIRRAVSLGADADTLGAIVGGMAEAIWDIPEHIKKEALSYLPDDMLAVINNFRAAIRERWQHCEHMDEHVAEIRFDYNYEW
ncbi:MAG: ADP-ribosylglycohydrolase family protein [Prevotella sp.]